MAAPITWRALQAPNLIGAATMMEGAQQSFNGGLDALRNSLTERKELERSNIGKMREYNTDQFLDKLAAYSTPEELAAAQASGEIDQFKRSLGVLNADEVRGAYDSRLKTARDQVTAGNTYKDQQTDLQYRPIVNQIHSLRAQGKIKEAQALIDANPEIRNYGELAADVNESRLAYKGEGRDDTRFGWEGNRERHASALRGFELNGARRSEEAAVEGIALDRQAQDTYAAATQARAQQQAGINALAGKFNFPMTRDGNVDIDALNVDQLTQLKTAVSDAGLDAVPTDTQVREQLRQQLIASTQYSLDQIDQVMTRLDSSFVKDTEVSAADQARIDKHQGAIDTATEIKKNSFYLSKDANPQAEAVKVMEKYSQDGQLLDIGDQEKRAEVTSDIMNTMAEGVTMADGSVVPVTPAIVDMALGSVRGAWWDADQDFKDVVRNLVARTPSLKTEYANYTYWEKESATNQAKGLGKYSGKPAANATAESLDAKLAQRRNQEAAAQAGAPVPQFPTNDRPGRQELNLPLPASGGQYGNTVLGRMTARDRAAGMPSPFDEMWLFNKIHPKPEGNF